VGRLISPLTLRSVVRGQHDRKVTWLELFFDLVFVAAVAQVAAPLRSDYTIEGLIRFSPLFVLIWWAWTGHAVFSTRFDTDDAIQRVLTLAQMFAVAVMAANARDALQSRSSAGFTAAYAAVRLVLVLQYFRARQVSEARPLTSRYIIGHGVAAIVWLVSALLTAPTRYWLWAVAFVFDFGTPWLTVKHSASAPPDAAHLPERFGLFTLILLGESLVAVMQGIESQAGWTATAALTAFFGMAILFVIWWWYFDEISSEQSVRTRDDAVRFHIWSYAHLPLYLGIVIAGVGIQRAVTAATHQNIDAVQSLIVTTAVAAVMAAMIAMRKSSAHRPIGESTTDSTSGLLVLATLAIGVMARPAPPFVLVMFLLACCAAQLWFSARHGSPGLQPTNRA
jgi:low temperature requirement protein LtrA